jgi:hypothetical protein
MQLPFENLDEMIRCQAMEYFLADRLGNDLFINDPDRADRIHEAAEVGADGSTHAETIQDWRDFLGQHRAFDPDFDDENTSDRLPEAVIDSINAEIDACEARHGAAGTLHEEIG